MTKRSYATDRIWEAWRTYGGGAWLCTDQRGDIARSWKATKQACREKATSNIPGSGGVRTNYGGRTKLGDRTNLG